MYDLNQPKAFVKVLITSQILIEQMDEVFKLKATDISNHSFLKNIQNSLVKFSDKQHKKLSLSEEAVEHYNLYANAIEYYTTKISEVHPAQLIESFLQETEKISK